MAADSPDPKDPVSPDVTAAPAPPEITDHIVADVIKDVLKNQPEPGVTIPGSLLTQEEWDHLSKRDQRLLKGIFERIARRETLARDPYAELRESRTFGQKLADEIAAFGGSWPFILLFFAFLAAWIVVNMVVFSREKAFDPYPFIFLNLVLSMLAAVQAPVIMMSQNRQTARDRAAAENDYAVNLRAEVEIRELNNKLDELREAQWVQLVAQQQEQIRLLEMLCGIQQDVTHDQGKRE